MKYRINRFSPHSAGKISGAIMGCTALLFWPFLLLAAMFGKAASPESAMPPLFMYAFMILLPVFYAVMGYLMAALSCALYNLFSKYVGKLTLEMEAMPIEPVQA